LISSNIIEDKILFIDLFPDLIRKLEIEDIIEIYSPKYLKLIYEDKVKTYFYKSVGKVLYTAQATY